MPSHPSLNADAGAIVALAVFEAPVIADSFVASRAVPALVADATTGFAHPVLTTIETAFGFNCEILATSN